MEPPGQKPLVVNGVVVGPFEVEEEGTGVTSNLVKVGLGISRTNADSQWNPVYNVFHRNFCCGNETIRQ